MPSIAKLTKEFIKETAELQTVGALVSGISGYEGKVSDLSPAKVGRYLRLLKKWKREVSSPKGLEGVLLKSLLTLREREWGPPGQIPKQSFHLCGGMDLRLVVFAPAETFQDNDC